MVQGALWFIGIYVMGIGLVHLSRLLFRRGEMKVKHFVFITHNNQLQVEWFMRSVLLFSWMKGTNIKITVLDMGSDDDTLAIVRRLTDQRYVTVNVQQTAGDIDDYIASQAGQEVIVMELNKMEDIRKMPLFQ